MHQPKAIYIKDYTYLLPEEKIATYPAKEREKAKLLIYHDGNITDSIYQNIHLNIPEDSLLIFNNSKVVEARLLFQKPSGGIIEIFCLEPYEQYADISMAMLQKEKVWWQCLIGGVSKWKKGQILEKKINTPIGEVIIHARFIEKKADSFIVEISWQPVTWSFAEVLHFAGMVPLPPYIHRPAEDLDKERYQTVYAKTDGSVAAPTAGLHFTTEILKNINKKNIQTEFITLHVGAGTFQPVKSETMQEHIMHAEWIDVPKQVIENIIKYLEKNIIAVGTTSLRTIESLYWMGVKISDSLEEELLELHQWEAYELAEKNIPVKDALQSLLNWLKKNNLEKIVAKTHLLVVPGYSFKIIKGLITNFHQPQSTLLLIIAALTGSDWKKIYDHAIQNNYRFLSYGDGSLLWKTPT